MKYVRAVFGVEDLNEFLPALTAFVEDSHSPSSNFAEPLVQSVTSAVFDTLEEADGYDGPDSNDLRKV